MRMEESSDTMTDKKKTHERTSSSQEVKQALGDILERLPL
jgi:hypothetical protein